MKNIDYNGYELCKAQADLFESSVEKLDCSSAVFVRRFMHSKISKSFDDMTYLLDSLDTEKTMLLLKEEYNGLSYGRDKVDAELMYWVGYIYRAIALMYNLSSKRVYKLLPFKMMVEYYPVYHTFDIEYAAERIMESIGYEEKNYTELGVKILRRLYRQEKARAYIGKKIIVDVNKYEHASNAIQFETTIAEEDDYFKVYSLNCINKDGRHEETVKAVMENGEECLLVISDSENVNRKDIEKQLNDKSYKIFTK